MKRILLLVLLVCPVLAQAQQAQGTTAASADSAFLRARELVVGGNGAAGRAIVDSMLAAARPGTPAYADALYWQASLASSAAAAEHDYQRLVVDYPFSAHTADALYALAQLETSRGDRAGAAAHLERLLLEHPTFPDRARAGLSLGRLLLDLGRLPKGCAVLERTRAGVPITQVELLNQIDYYAQRCQGVDTTQATPKPAPKPARIASGSKPAAESTRTRAPRADSVRRSEPRREATRKHADTAAGHAAAERRDSASRREAAPRHDATTRHEAPPTRAHAAVTRYTVQVAAYETQGDAERLVKRLRARGMEARVVGTSKPFRVRLGRFATRSEAVAEEHRLKARGIAGFVTTEPEAR